MLIGHAIRGVPRSNRELSLPFESVFALFLSASSRDE